MLLSYNRGQQVNLCYQTSISLIFCYCSDSFSTSNQIDTYKRAFSVCKKRGLMAVNVILRFSFDIQILY